jgi:hypothetical protein
MITSSENYWRVRRSHASRSRAAPELPLIPEAWAFHLR